MKNVTMKVSLYAAAAFVLSAVPGFAQQTGHVSVVVPFEFTAGMATLPAGDYEFQEQQNGVVLISSVRQHIGVVVLTSPAAGQGLISQPSVKFDKTAGAYALSELDLVGQPARRLIHFDHEASAVNMTAKAGVTNAASKGLLK